MTGLRDMAIERLEIATRGGRVLWHLAGSGPPLLLIHGGAGSWTHWLRVIPALGDEFRLLAPDLPGFGGSDLPPKPADPRALAAQVREGLDLLLPRESRLAIAGFSFGGLVSGLLASEMAERITRLVLVGPSGLGMPSSLPLPLRSWRGLSACARSTVHRHNLATLMIGREEAIDEETIALQAENAERARINSRPFSAGRHLLESLESERPPLGAIWGGEDAIARHDLHARIAVLRRLDPALPVAVIPGAGHWVAHEQPAAFAAVLKAMIHSPGGVIPPVSQKEPNNDA